LETKNKSLDLSFSTLKDKKFVFWLLLIFPPFHQIPILKATSSLIIHTKNTSGQQKIYKKEKIPENQPNSATPRTEISLNPDSGD